MGRAHKTSGDAAIQLLIWAIEEIEKTGDEKALFHSRAALKRIQRIYSPSPLLRRDVGTSGSLAKCP
jgi:hypothetical protein